MSTSPFPPPADVVTVLPEERTVYGMQLPVQSQSTIYTQPWETAAGPDELAAVALACEAAGFFYVGVCDHTLIPERLAGAMSTWCIRTAAYATLERGYDLTLVSDAHTTSDIDRGNGTVVAAEDIVDELNVAMTWQDYPGRRSQTATAAEVVF